MASSRHNPRRAKSHFSYTINEVAELYGGHRQTVRHWLGDGLSPNDKGKPVLIHGSELNRFHVERRAGRKRPCGAGELFCLGCRVPRRPAGEMADFLPGPGEGGTLKAICPTCERMMTQRVNALRLAQFQAELEVTIRPPPEPIRESRQARLNHHLQHRSMP